MGKYDNLAALGDEAGDAVRQTIRAYHGSPHDFDRFDASKIGTGEGAQAYGHGLYFAGAEDVARSYRDITPSLLPPEAAEIKQQISQLIKQHSDLTGELQMAADIDGTFTVGWGNFKAPPEVARARILPQLADVNKQLADVQARMRDVLAGRRGHMYEVEIGQPESSLLDFDAPISAQSPAVMAALRKLDVVPELPSSVPWEPTGQHAYRRLIELRLANARNAPQKAADRLAEEGVPGIRYLDGYSRGAREGTNNYVMFPGTEDSIRILRKYAIPGAVGTGVASQYEESP